MVLARLLAEMTVLVVLALLPALALIGGQLNLFALPLKMLFFALSGVALIALPGYGYMTWAVTVNEDGLSTFALCRRQKMSWSALRGLRLKASLFWRRYVVEGADGELTFPIWLEEQKELLDCIRKHLPQGKVTKSESLAYRQTAIYIVFQFVKMVLSFVFVVVFWLFYVGSSLSGKLGQGDLLLLLCAGLCTTGVIAWRALVVAAMPRYMELGKSELTIGTCFFERHIPWAATLKLTPAPFLLPEGMILKTTQGAFLIASDSDGAGELIEEIQDRLNKIKSA